MWSAILLFIERIKTSNKIKKKERNQTRRQLHKSSDTKEIKKLKTKLRIIDISIIATVVIPIIATILAFLMFFYILLMMGGIFGFRLTREGDDEGVNASDEKNWQWEITPSDSGSIISPGIESVVSGGLYPKDPTLKNRAVLLQVLQRSSDDVLKTDGIYVDPAYILGTFARETANKVYITLDSYDDPFKMLYDILYSDPVCGKSSTSCSYITNGYSHFVGGTVVNGKDMGDPYTQKVNTDKDLYKALYTKGGHAIGFLQNEIPYVPTLTAQFPVEDEFKIDVSTIGITRPNIFYLPDIVYYCTYRHSWTPAKGTGSNYTTIMTSSDFNKLSDRNKAFIRFIYAGAAYGRGNVNGDDDIYVKQLIEVANSGKVTNLDEAFLNSNYYNKDTHMPTWGSKAEYKKIANEYYGLNIPSDAIIWYGVFAANIGRVAWNELTAEINAAEKEGIALKGNYINYIGSGDFANPTNSPYYCPDLSSVWFSQGASYKGGSTVFGTTLPAYTTTIQNKKYLTSEAGAQTYNAWGCPAYAMAMLLSNITGIMTMPDGLPGTTEASNGWPVGTRNVTTSGYSFTPAPATIEAVNQRLTNENAGYQLKFKLLTQSQLQSVESHLYEWLDRGAMLYVRVTRSLSESGGNHFVTISGYDKTTEYNGYHDLRVLNSIVGNNAYTLIDAGNGQRVTAKHLSEHGLAYHLRNYSTYCCMVIWRTDISETLPGLD